MHPVAAAVLAHQGGWDEALFVAVPMAVLVALLWLAQKRAAEEEGADGAVSERSSAPEPTVEPDPDGR